MRRHPAFLLIPALVLLLSACGRNMEQQPSVRAYENSPHLPGNTSMLTPPANTVSREEGAIDRAFLTGVDVNGNLLTEFPVEVTDALLERGRQRFEIYCSVCHNHDGSGTGVVVQRGFPQPQSFHTDEVRGMPVGFYVQVITNGFGRMYPYASRVSPPDRWAITAYIRALQLSQNPGPLVPVAPPVPEVQLDEEGNPIVPEEAETPADDAAGLPADDAPAEAEETEAGDED